MDEELFEDNPIEYIRRDLEGSGKSFVYMIHVHQGATSDIEWL